MKKALEETANSEHARTKWSWIRGLRNPYTAHAMKLISAQGKVANLKETAETFAEYLSQKHHTAASHPAQTDGANRKGTVHSGGDQKGVEEGKEQQGGGP